MTLYQLGNEYTHRNLNFQTIYYEDGSTFAWPKAL